MEIRTLWPWILSAVLILLLLLSSSLLPAQSYFYDGAGRLVQVAYAEGSGVRYVYDAADNLTGVTPLSLPPAPALIRVARQSPTSAALVWRDASNQETGFLIQRRSSENRSWETVAVVGSNVTSFVDTGLNPETEYVYRVVAQSDSGFSGYSAEVTPSPAGPPGSSADRLIDPLGVATLRTVGSDGPAQPGYAVVDVTSGSTPYGTAVFGLSQNGVVVSEAGVPASPPALQSRIFIDYRTRVEPRSNEFQGTIEINTGLAVVNTGSEVATVEYLLRDRGGSVISSGNGTLQPGAHFARFINQLNEVAPDFVLPADFATAVQFGSLDLISSQPLSVLALRLTTNQRGEALLTTTPVANLEDGAVSDSLYFPQFADGDGFTSSLVLLNTTGQVQTGTIRLFDSGGALFEVRESGGSLSSVFPYSVARDGSFVLQTDGSSSGVKVGWALLTPDPGSTAPVAAGVFRLSQDGLVVTESGIPSASLTRNARVYVDTTRGHNTGLAVANPSGQEVQIEVEAYEGDGETPAGEGAVSPVQLSARGQQARFVTELVEGLPEDFTGVLDLQSQTPFAALTLRSLVNGRGDFLLTTFPVADLNRPAPEPVIFPQIADGGGIRTEFILINPGNDTVIHIRFFNDEGLPLPVLTP